MRAVLFAIISSTLCGCAPPAAAPDAAAPPTPAAASSEAAAEYLVVAPSAFTQALAPLIAHRRAQGLTVKMVTVEDINRRSKGQSDPRAVLSAIERVQAAGALRYVLLVGDAARDDEPSEQRIAAFYLKKVDYFTHDHDSPLAHRLLRRRPADAPQVTESGYDAFPSDHPYALMASERPLAVGRVPARTAAEVSAFVRKVIRYEAAPVTTAWQRRIIVRSGPAGFSRMIDKALEATALTLLDEGVPYDFDLRFTYSKPGSPYADRFDRLGEGVRQDAERGAFFMAYVGHSSPTSFQSVSYREQYHSLGTVRDFEQMNIEDGAPMFVSLSCDVGAFDMHGGQRSIAEEAVLNPNGPIAAFAASRVSHPYPNLLYGDALIEVFLNGRPATVGEGIVAVKQDMLGATYFLGELFSKTDTADLKSEHAALYNLLGDPATRLRYATPLDVKISSAAVAPNAKLTVEVNNSEAGEVTFTLETKRRTMREGVMPADEIDELPLTQALEQERRNHRLANDKVLQTWRTQKRSIEFAAPAIEGEYVMKVFVKGNSGASGHARFEVAAPRAAVEAQ